MQIIKTMIFDFISSRTAKPQANVGFIHVAVFLYIKLSSGGSSSSSSGGGDDDDDNSMQINYYKIDLLAQAMSNFAIFFG